jgi:RNA polymerase-binding transcription factor
MATSVKVLKTSYAELERLLRETREELLERSDQHQREAVPDRSPDDEGAEAARNLLEHLSFDTVERERKLLKEIDAALERIKDGSYGTCERCGKEIAMRRLRAVPWARYCLICAEQGER